MRLPVFRALSGRPGARAACFWKVIANVVMNRLGHEGFPNTICEVVKAARSPKFAARMAVRMTQKRSKFYAIAKNSKSSQPATNGPNRWCIWISGKQPPVGQRNISRQSRSPSFYLQASRRQIKKYILPGRKTKQNLNMESSSTALFDKTCSHFTCYNKGEG